MLIHALVAIKQLLWGSFALLSPHCVVRSMAAVVVCRARSTGCCESHGLRGVVCRAVYGALRVMRNLHVRRTCRWCYVRSIRVVAPCLMRCLYRAVSCAVFASLRVVHGLCGGGCGSRGIKAFAHPSVIHGLIDWIVCFCAQLNSYSLLRVACFMCLSHSRSVLATF